MELLYTIMHINEVESDHGKEINFYINNMLVTYFVQESTTHELAIQSGTLRSSVLLGEGGLHSSM
jgi:hypothetical protein